MPPTPGSARSGSRPPVLGRSSATPPAPRAPGGVALRTGAGRGLWHADPVSDEPAAAPLDAAAPAPLTGPALVAAYLLVLLLAVLLALWGAFLVPLRLGTVPLPVSWVVAAVGNGALGWAGGRLLGRAGAAGPGIVWVVIALTLGSRRAEGDLVVPGSVPGLVFLLVGAVASAAAYSATARRR